MLQKSGILVAPHAGAWIEIIQQGGLANALRSPPTRGRGLKLDAYVDMLNAQVAPHAGAWIEIIKHIPKRRNTMSPPTRGRGLKSDQ